MTGISAGALPDATLWLGKRVLLTGHTGFKGAWLHAWLATMQAQVFGFALAPAAGSLCSQLGSDFDSSQSRGNINNAAQVGERFSHTQPEVVFHFAAQALVRQGYADPIDTFLTNLMGTVHVLEAARHCPSVKAVVIVTTDKVYQNKEWAWAYRECDPLGGHDPYSASKACAELATSAYRSSFMAAGAGAGARARCLVASVRAGNVIGPGDYAKDRLVPDALRAFAGGETLQLRMPHATRPWQHVLEPLNGYLLVAQALLEGRVDLAPALNFGPERASVASVGQVAQLLARLWGEQATVASAGVSDKQQHEAGLLNLDSALAQSQLGWQSRWDLPTALAATVRGYRQLGVAENPSQALAVLHQQIDAYCVGESLSA